MMNQAGVPPVSEILIRSAWYRLGYMSKTEKLFAERQRENGSRTIAMQEIGNSVGHINGEVIMKKRKFLECAVMTTLVLGIGGQVYAEGSATTYELAPIVVTANRVPEKLVDTKADISVVPRKQIENLHLETVEDTLREVPGTQFLNYGSNGLNANLSGVRINGSKDVVILVDGVRVTDFQGANNSGYM